MYEAVLEKIAMRKSMRLGWVVLWVIANLIMTLYFISRVMSQDITDSMRYEIELLSLICFGLISFPFGTFILIIAKFLVAFFGIGLMEVYGSAATISLIAFSCMLGGLIQWFYVIPCVAVWFKKRMA